MKRSPISHALSFLTLAAGVSVAFSFAPVAIAQDGGGGGGGGGGGQVVTPVVPTTPVAQQPVSNQTTADVQGDSQVDINDASTLNFGGDTVDRRNQGFVGATGERIGNQGGFVGAGSTLGPALDSETNATYGGGVNDGNGDLNQQSAVVPSVNASGFQAAQPLGSEIVRRSIRARVRPQFSRPEVIPGQVANEFISTMARQPSAAPLTGRFSITVENKTAYLTGSVDNLEQANKIVRQLRLQPGVYKIVNQLQVLN